MTEETRKINIKDYLRQIIRAGSSADQVEEVVKGLSLQPDDIEPFLGGLTEQNWEQVYREVRQEFKKQEDEEARVLAAQAREELERFKAEHAQYKADEAERRKEAEEEAKRLGKIEGERSSKKFLIPLAVVSALVLLGLVWMGGRAWYCSQSPTPDGCPVTSVPPAAAGSTVVVETQIVTQMVEKTVVVTAEAPVPPTEPPVAAPANPFPSRFMQMPVIYPPVPVSAEAIWIIPVDEGAVNPQLSDGNVWVKVISTDKATSGREFFSTGVGKAHAEWKMDQALPGGIYQLFARDTLDSSAGEQDYTVRINQQPAVPLVGSYHAFYNKKSGGQKADEWIPLGIFEVSGENQVIDVIADISERNKDFPYALDQVMLVKLPGFMQPLIQPIVEHGKGRPLVQLADNSLAALGVISEGKFVVNDKEWSQVISPAAWNGSYHFLPDAKGTIAAAEWKFPGRVAAGKYEIMAYIPAENAQAGVMYDLYADGVLVERPTKAEILQSQSQGKGEWVSLGVWELTKDGSLVVRGMIKSENPAFFAVDALAMFKAE